MRTRIHTALFAAIAAALLLLSSCATPQPAAPKAPTAEELVTAYNDGWIDGQADLTGDDDRNGVIDEDESGWDCKTMGNRICGPTPAPTN